MITVSDLPIKEFRIAFLVTVGWSIVLLLYDFIMLKIGLYKKILRKAKSMTPEKYRGFKSLLFLIMPVVPLIALSNFIIIGFITGEWEFWMYVFGMPTVLSFPSWLILKHVGQIQVDKMNND